MDSVWLVICADALLWMIMETSGSVMRDDVLRCTLIDDHVRSTHDCAGGWMRLANGDV